MLNKIKDFIRAEMDPFKNAINSGNQYRLEKYGPTESHDENMARITEQELQRKVARVKVLSMFASNEELEEIQKFKARFHYWDCWTGSRFERVENPLFKELNNNITPNTICRSDPVTGYWHAL